MTGKWDSVPQATNLTLETPGKDIERVEVEFDPNTAYDPKTGLPMTELSNYSVQSVSMIPSEDGEVTACSFPVSSSLLTENRTMTKFSVSSISPSATATAAISAVR